MADVMATGYFRGGRRALNDELERKKAPKYPDAPVIKRTRSRSPPNSGPPTPTKKGKYELGGNLGTARGVNKVGALFDLAAQNSPRQGGISPRSRTSKPPIIETRLDDNGDAIMGKNSPRSGFGRTNSTASTSVPNDFRRSWNSTSSMGSDSGNVPEYMSGRNSWRLNEGTSPAWGLPLSPKIGALPPLPRTESNGSNFSLTGSNTPSGGLKRTSSGPGGSPKSENATLSDTNRAHMRNKLLDVLENPDDAKENRWTEFIDDIVQLGPNPEAIYDLYQVPITRRILEKTDIGKVLQSGGWKHLAGADRLIRIWRGEIKKRSGNISILEAGIHGKYVINGELAKNAAWRYTQDVRSIISLLKKDYNEGTRERLTKGEINPSNFLNDFYQRPDVFESPSHAMMRKKSKEEEEGGVEKIELKFPNFDSTLTCSNCKAVGCYYKVLALDELNYSREVCCKECKFEWMLNE